MPVNEWRAIYIRPLLPAIEHINLHTSINTYRFTRRDETMNKDWIGNQTGQLVLLLCTVYHSGHFSSRPNKTPLFHWLVSYKHPKMSKLVSYRSAEKSQTPVPRRRPLACLLWLVSNPPCSAFVVYTPLDSRLRALPARMKPAWSLVTACLVGMRISSPEALVTWSWTSPLPSFWSIS